MSSPVDAPLTPEEELEARLLPRAVAGDRDAIEQLLVVRCEELLRYVQRKLPTSLNARIDAEDVLQQTYLEAWKAIGRFEPRGPRAFFAWLRTIAERKIIDATRRAGREEVLPQAPASPADSSISNQIERNVVSDGPGTGTKAMRGEMRGAFHVALATLPANYREVVELRYIQDLPLEEVATRLGITEGAARGLCHRARQALREAIGRLSRFV